MGLKILLGIVWLSLCGLPRFGECVSWTGTIYNEKKVYTMEDSSYTFNWRYNDGSTNLQFAKWTFINSKNNKLITIATKSGVSSVQVSPDYSDRTSVSNGANLEVRKLKYPADEGVYSCEMTFKNFETLKDHAHLIVVEAPTITTKTSGPITIAELDTKTLECAADGNPKPRIKWTLKDDHDNVREVQNSYNHFGYNITNAGRKDKGVYTCEAIVTGGGYVKTISYQVQVDVKYKPEVEHLTANQSRTENSDVTLECSAVGDPPVTQYWWYKKEVLELFKIKNGGSYVITGSLGNKLTIKGLTKAMSDWYYCAAENSLGIGNGTKTYVTALYAPTDVRITYIPPSTVNLTQSVTLKCVSDGVPAPAIAWTFNGHLLDPKVQVIRGERNEEVRIERLTKELTGNYTCFASNLFGNKKTLDILHVNHKPEKPYFTTGIEDFGVILFSRARLTCKADGYPPPKFIIKKNDVVISSLQDYVLFPSVRLSDETDKYKCIPYNFMGQGPETAPVSIIVLIIPTFIESLYKLPSKMVMTENATYNYTCIADAKPYAEIKWYINGDNVTFDKPLLGVVSTITKQSPSKDRRRTDSTLILNPITWRHNGNISCTAVNNAGATLSYTLLEVRHRPVVRDAKDLPNNKTVDTGQSVTFSCPAIGNPPTISYKWYFNDKELSGERSRTLTLSNVRSDDVGEYSCVGINVLGQGPAFGVQLFIKTPAKVTYHPKVKANESSSPILECQATGIPKPVIRWYRGPDKKVLHVGEKYRLVNVTYEDRGFYQCTATNELNEDKVNVELEIQVKPNITSNKPTDTQVAGVVGEKSSLTCTVLAMPLAEIWFTRESDSTHLTARSERVVSINVEGSGKTLFITANRLGEIYYCHAKNLLGYVRQKYTIRDKGPPDAPINLKPYTIQVNDKRTVNVNVTWIAGYSGGYPQFFTILYKLLDAKVFTEIVIDNAAGTNYTITDLKPHTTYVFKIRPRNEKGLGSSSKEVHYTTGASDIPPARGTLEVSRIEDGTVFQIIWTANKNVTAIYIEYREVTTTTRARRSITTYEYGRWNNVEGAQGLSPDVKNFLVVNLDADKTYQFRVLFKVANEFGFKPEMVVESEIIQPLVKTEARTGLKQHELIAIIAACGGVLLILIVVLCLCCFKRRKKAYGADSVQMSQTGSAPNLFMSYGDTAETRVTNRRSYATESVEDDPFINANIANEMKKKRRPTENGVNHGYASQDSLPNQEILLNPGMRSGMRGLSQSVGQLDGSTSYSSTGPQRDFSTLPPEPPSFEEAIRQSVKKSKQALSTGDLTAADPRGPYHGRSRPRTPDSDTSDSEVPLNRRPMFKVKPIDPATDKRYKSAPALPPLESPVRKGPRDPSTLYARPNKKVLRYREPVDMFGSPPWEYIDHNYHAKASSPSGWPPPSYTPEDRAVISGMADDYESRNTKRRPKSDDVLELQDHPSYRNDRLPDLPPSMPQFNNRRGTMDKEPLGETLPEPPSFLRDLSDDEADGRYQRSYTEPRGNRSRPKQPYVNIHGQLVKPGSAARQPAYGADNQEPIYANDPPRLVAPEPEVPANQRRNRQPSTGSEQHKPGYVSSGFLV